MSEIEDRLGNLSIGVEIATGGGAEVLGSACPSDTPVSPNVPLNLTVGLIFGLFVGIVLAFVRDYFDDSVKTKETVDRVTGVPTLGLIPKVAGGDELVTIHHPTAPAARPSASSAPRSSSSGSSARCGSSRSPVPPRRGQDDGGDDLAVAFAQAGDRVVLVGADLRRPRMEDVLDVPLTPGLTAVLIGDVTLPQAIQTAAGSPTSRSSPQATRRPTSELLSGERARRLIDVLGQTYDVVVIDCPPVLPVTDSLVLADGRHDAARHVRQHDVQAQPDPGGRAAAPGGCTRCPGRC